MPRRLLSVALIGLALVASPAASAPRLPDRDDEVLETVPAADRLAAAWQARLRAMPDDLDTATALARHWTGLARRRQDSRYAGYAEAVLAPWWGQLEPPVEVLLLRATLRQHRHDFTGALADLERAAGRAGQDPRIWLMRAGVERTLGRQREALASCRRIGGGRAAALAALCVADAMAHSGEAAAAIDRIDAALASRGGLDDGYLAWAWTLRAEAAERLGNAAEAESSWRTAIAADPADDYARLGLVDLLIDQDRAAEALRLLGGDRRSDGRLLRLALAGRAVGDEGWEADASLLRDRLEAALRRGDTVAQREEVRLLLGTGGDPAVALDLALANWAAQREPWDARLLLEAAIAAGRPAEAAPVVEWIAATGIEDPRLRRLARQVEEAAR